MNIKMLKVFVVAVLLFSTPFSAAARGATLTAPAKNGASVLPQGIGSSASVTFADLGYPDSDLVGPFDSTRKTFSAPANWRIQPGGIVVLNYDVIFTGVDVGLIESASNAYVGLLTITFNNDVIGEIRLDDHGSQTRQFEIPAAALASVRPDGRNELKVQLTAQFDCLYDIRTVVVVKSTSGFNLPFEILPPELNLSRLPAPFYLRNSLLPDRTLLVLADSPSIEELQGAINVKAGFGSMVGQSFDFQMVSFGQLTNDAVASSNLIFVGTPDDFPILENVNFSTPISGGQFVNLPAEAAQDGIVELAPSPWNSSKVILLVSGNSGQAVIKAARAVSSGNVFVYQNPAYAYVADVQKLPGELPVEEDFLLQTLGYENITLHGIGINSTEYSFFVSKEQVDTTDGQITLVYSHSGLLDYGLSSLSVDLNGQVISSQPFSEDSEQVTSLPIKIPAGMLRYGENKLLVNVRMQPNLSCDFTGFSDPWLTISNQTALHLPAEDAAADIRPLLIDLKYYPGMLMTRSDLGDLVFVLSKNDQVGWTVAAEMAARLGEDANPSIPNIQAVFADDVPQDLRVGHSLIFVGKASTLPLLVELNDQLPAPFDLNTNTASERDMQIIYRIPPGMSVGYLELMVSPYDSEHLALIVSGNTDLGVQMAGNALLTDILKDQLAGVFAVTNGTQVAISDSHNYFSVVGTLVPGSEQVVTTPLSPTTSPPSFTRPAWLVPVLTGSGALVALIILFVAIRTLTSRRLLQAKASSGKPSESEETPAKK